MARILNSGETSTALALSSTYNASRATARTLRFVFLAASLWLTGSGSTAVGDEAYGGGPPPHAEAAFTEHPPKIDGVWSEQEWAEAKPIFFPAATDKAACEVRFLWTKEGVYVAFRTVEPQPFYGDFKPGDPLYQEDAFELFIDQAGDHAQYYEIQMDPAGQSYLRNYVLTAPPRLTPEQRLTPEFCDRDLWRYDVPKPDDMRIASKLDPVTHVWTLEAFLPASFVNRRRGGAPMTPCTWRLNLARYDWDAPKDVPDRTAKFSYWSPVLPGHPHLSPQAMGWLELKKP